MSPSSQGNVFERGDAGYGQARRVAVWNARTPERSPDVLVQAADEDHVVRAVLMARERGLRLGVRSGGHSWAGNHLRDGGMLLDVSRLTDIEIDADGMRAAVGPGCRGEELLCSLAEQGLFFPAGHCPGVALGGYLLQGGCGWNGRVHGPACMSVHALDLHCAEEFTNLASLLPELYARFASAAPG